ncbi:MAG TPA: hypothetical protein VHM30_04915, partial [Gemmatimonadaceae bacterium]|nr:hypothetical protein [Gemmatimonadaceae bacterium]
EMLGRAFETLMASRERRASGAFYTPHQIVAEATSEALASYLASQGLDDDAARTLVRGGDVAADARTLAAPALDALRLVDPACGSGAFLVHALERVAELRARCGARGDTSTLRRAALARSIFGVDSNPAAVWLCELRLWLAAVIDEERDDPLEVPPLPNLDHNIRVGDSLAGMGFHDAPRGGARKVEALRLRYARATGRRKQVLGAELDRIQRCAVLRELDASIAAANHQRRERVVAGRSRDLFGGRAGPASPSTALLRARVRALRDLRESVRRGAAMPFSWGATFPDVATRGGFDVAIGNPPWVRLHNIPERSRERLRRDFEVFRNASWEAGAEGAGVRRGFAAQIDLAALFVERATQLLRPAGTLALLLPAKLWRSLAGGGVRRLLVRRAPPRLIDDWSESAVAFDAAVYPSLLVARVSDGGSAVDCALRHRHESLRWSIPRTTLPLDDTDGSPWIIAPGRVRDGFDRLRARGVPLAATPFGRPRLGIKCGCNDAFVVAGDVANVERERLRPIVRGETLSPWRLGPTERIVWTHDDDGAPLHELPPGVLRHLTPHRRALAARSDARATSQWWSLFRVEGALPGAPRVVWADVGRVPRAACIAADDPTLALNSCYVARAPTPEDALALTALLNSPLLAAWLALLAEPARGGYRRFLGWTMALLPLPRDWVRARALLAPLTTRAMEGDVPPADLLLDVSVRAFQMRASDLAPLVEWTHR